MPLDGWDHVELWVGNAKQAAYFYEHAFGFRADGLRRPRDGHSRPRLLRAGAGRHPLRADERAPPRLRDRPATPHVHGDGVKDIALRVPTRTRPTARRCSAARAASPSRARSRTSSARVELAAIADLRRRRPHLRQPLGLRGRLPARLRGPGVDRTAPASGVGLLALDHVVGNVELGRMDHWVEFYERVFGMTEHDPLQRRGHLHRVLRAHVEGDGGRPGEDQVPDQRAGRGQAQEPDRGVPRVQPRPGRRSTSRCQTTNIVEDGRGAAASAASSSSPRPRRTTTRRRTASATSTSPGTTCAGCASSSTGTTTATCCRSSRRRRRTGRRSSSR